MGGSHSNPLCPVSTHTHTHMHTLNISSSLVGVHCNIRGETQRRHMCICASRIKHSDFFFSLGQAHMAMYECVYVCVHEGVYVLMREEGSECVCC